MREAGGQRPHGGELLRLARPLREHFRLGHVLTDGEEHDVVLLGGDVREVPAHGPRGPGAREQLELEALARIEDAAARRGDAVDVRLPRLLRDERVEEPAADDLVALPPGATLRLAVEEEDHAVRVEPHDEHARELHRVPVPVIDARQRRRDAPHLEALRALHAGDEVLPVGLHHHRELDVEELAHGGGHLRPVRSTLARGDAHERHAHERHRGEHVPLRQPDADVHLADLRRLLEVRVVVHAGEEAIEPGLEGAVLTGELLLAAEHDEGVLVLADALVELARDAGEMGGGKRRELEQRLRVGRVEADVALQLLEPGLVRRLYAAVGHRLAVRVLRGRAQVLHLMGSSRGRARPRGE